MVVVVVVAFDVDNDMGLVVDVVVVVDNLDALVVLVVGVPVVDMVVLDRVDDILVVHRDSSYDLDDVVVVVPPDDLDKDEAGDHLNTVVETLLPLLPVTIAVEEVGRAAGHPEQGAEDSLPFFTQSKRSEKKM